VVIGQTIVIVGSKLELRWCDWDASRVRNRLGTWYVECGCLRVESEVCYSKFVFAEVF